MITIDDFSKIEIKIGTVLEATKIPEADRLIKIFFDFGSLQEGTQEISRLPELLEQYPGRDVRQIMSAIAPFFPDPQMLVGKQMCVLTNLEPRKFKGYESQGMLMAVDSKEGGIIFISPEKNVSPGTKVH